MRFRFPTTAIATVCSSALIVTSCSQQIGASINLARGNTTTSVGASATTQGNECVFNNPVKIQETEVDIGILACGADETCAEDETSSLGGRCMILDTSNEVVGSHNEFVACTFANGMNGKKCVGHEACGGGTDHSKIGCGSCIGDFSCASMSDITVGEHSCIYPSACYGAIGNYSLLRIFAVVHIDAMGVDVVANIFIPI